MRSLLSILLIRGRKTQKYLELLDIPLDILLEILIRLPVKSILRFKSVHSSWVYLISSSEFSHKHLSHSRKIKCKHGIIQIGNTHTVYPSISLRSLCTDNHTNHELVEAQNVFGEVSHNFYSHIELIGSCDGILAIGARESIILWNPSTREHKKINRENILAYEMTGLCHDSFNDNYKIVLKIVLEQSIHIYDLKTSRWEKTDHFPYRGHVRQNAGITLPNGILHWIVSRPKSLDYEQVLLSFDPVDGKFKEIPLPANNTCYVSALHGFLCVLCEIGFEKPDVWVMRKYDMKSSWIKLYTLSLPSRFRYSYSIPLELTKKEFDVVMNLGGKTLAKYSPDRDESESLLLSRSFIRSTVATYVESLISISDGK